AGIAAVEFVVALFQHDDLAAELGRARGEHHAGDAAAHDRDTQRLAPACIRSGHFGRSISVISSTISTRARPITNTMTAATMAMAPGMAEGICTSMATPAASSAMAMASTRLRPCRATRR